MAAADEPRRSGRATKGQHTKNEEDTTPEPPKARGRGKSSKKDKNEPDQPVEDEEEEEGDDSILCLCGVTDDEEDGRNFLCCDKCETWQHNDCMGLPAKYNPAQYFCWRCRPEDYPLINEALAQGEKPEEVAARMRTRKPAKKGRQSLRGPTAKTETESATSVPEQNKRKHAGDENGDQPLKRGKSSTPAMSATPATENTGTGRGRGRRGKAQAAEAAEEPKLAESIQELSPDTRKRIAAALRDKFATLIKDLVAKGAFKLAKQKTAEALAESQAIAVEHNLFLNQCNHPTDFSGGYQSQFRTIISNMAQNPTLLLSLLDGQVTANALSKMSSADMATEEQKKLDEKMRKDGEKQAMLIQEDGPRIRRTHKGEELVEEIGGFASESITSAAPPRRMLSNTDEDDMTPADSKPTRPAPIVTSQDSPPEGHRRSLSNFNIQNVWSKVQSPTTDIRSPVSRSASASVPQKQQQPDAEIDELLNRDGEDSAPYSPVDAGHDPYLVWRGNVDMPVQSNSIFNFPANAYHMAGFDLGGKDQQAGIFPKDLILAGRIAADTADNYLTSLSAAKYTDVSVFELIPHGHDSGVRDQFNKLFSYLKDRKRFGVISESTHRGNVRDVYLIPLNAGNDDTPLFLSRLAHNMMEDPRTRQVLLVAFVLRYKEPGSASAASPDQAAILSPTGQTPGRAPSMSIPAMSPATATEERGPMPPFPQQGAPGQSGGQYSFPSNPYAPATSGSEIQAQNRELAASILGPMVNAPVAQSILATAATVLSPGHLQSLRKIFENHPSAQTDMQEVQRALGTHTTQ